MLFYVICMLPVSGQERHASPVVRGLITHGSFDLTYTRADDEHFPQAHVACSERYVKRFLPPKMRIGLAVAGIAATAAFGLVVVPRPANAQVSCNGSSLVAAINAANSSNGTVDLAGGCTYVLTSANNTPSEGPNGLPVISGNVTINGHGASILRSGSAVFRIFDVIGTLNLNNVNVLNGFINGGGTGGGGIYNQGSGHVNVFGGTLGGNSGNANVAMGTGGGAILSSGALTVNDVTFLNNVAQEGAGIMTSGGTLSVVNSTFVNGTATNFGGGALVTVAGAANQTISGTTVIGNSGPGGGAIDNDLPQSSPAGTRLLVDRSTFIDNSAGPNGGGAVVNFGLMTITESTFWRNTASSGGADIHTFCCASFTPPAANTTISQSIVANPGSATNCTTGNSVTGGTATMTDGGYNLDSGTSCGFTINAVNNADPLLGRLQWNGGPTQTLVPDASSPAVNRIPTGQANCPGSDQRGAPRPQGGSCDIGSTEFFPLRFNSPAGNAPGAGNAPSATADSAGHQFVFWKGADGHLWEAMWNGSGWSGPIGRGMGTLGSPPTAAFVPGLNEVDVFWKGTENSLWEAVGASGGTSWSGPFFRGFGPLGTQPSATAHGSEVDVFWRGTDNNLWEGYAVSGTWHGPVGIGMGPLGSNPSAAAHASGTQAVFWRGTDSRLWEGFWNGTRWVGPIGIGLGSVASAPAAVVVPGNDQENVFWQAGDANIYTGWFSPAGGWQGGVLIGMGPLGSAPTAAAWGSEIDLFWRGMDANLWEGYSPGDIWHGPQSIGMGPLG